MGKASNDAVAATPVAPQVRVFTKDKVLSSARYKGQRDLINALLEDDKAYSLGEVDKLVADYLGHETGSVFRQHKRHSGGKGYGKGGVR